MIRLSEKKSLTTKSKIHDPVFSFSTELGKEIKRWLKQIFLTYLILWIFWIISIFFYFHTELLFNLYTFSQLKKSVLVPVNFNFLFKLNLFYLAVEFTVVFLSIVWIVWICGFFLTNLRVSLFLYKHTWLIMFIFYLILLFINWDCFIDESALYSFRNKSVTTEQILNVLFESTRFRYNKFFWVLLFNINWIISGFLCLFGFMYLWIRIYFWWYDKFWSETERK